MGQFPGLFPASGAMAVNLHWQARSAMTIAQDVSYAVRVLRRSPGFLATSVLTLALGIGATTAIFTVADAMLWKPVPLPELDRLTMVLQRNHSDPNDWKLLSPADFTDLRNGATAFQSFSGFEDGLANIVGQGGEPARVQQVLATADFFETVGVQPALGRAFVAGEDQPGRDHVVILSDGVWRRNFGANPGVVGKTLRLDDDNYQVIGVMPRSYNFPLATEIWTPMALSPEKLAARTGGAVFGVARLRPGVSVSRAASQVDAVSTYLERQYPATHKNERAMILPLHRFLIGEYNRQYTLMLLVAVLFVLLIACVNVANLQLARASGRRREVAVRTALGAARWQLIRQVLVESLIVSLIGSGFGLLLAAWGIDMIRAGMPAEVERYILGWKYITLDLRGLGFTLVLAVFSGLVAGLAPAFQSYRRDLQKALREGGRTSSAGRNPGRIRGILVASEIALAIVLLVGAGLMVRGFQNLLQDARAFGPDTLLTMRLAITETKYREPRQVAAFYRDVLQSLSSLPGVRSAAAVTAVPHSSHSSGRLFTVEGKAPAPGNPPACQYQVASANYFATLRIPLRAGRTLSDSDGPDNQLVGVISERFAQRHFSGERSPIGKRLKLGLPDSKNPWITIVGVVGDVRHQTFDREPRSVLYVPYVQAPARWMDLAIRTSGDPLNLAASAAAAIRKIDPQQPVTSIHTLAQLIRIEATGLDYVAALMAIFGVLALVLSCVGVYGVMSYIVAEQTHDIGVRMALGASKPNVITMIFRRGFITTMTGIAIGLALALGLARLLASLVYGVGATDPLTFAGIPLTLAIAAGLAIWIPARRATATDPVLALRHE